MQYRTHQVGGLCAGIIAGVTMIGGPYTPSALGALSIVVVASTVGSVIPDIDEPNSIAGRKIWIIAKIIKRVFGHRMITHTPIFVLALAIGLYYIGQNYVLNTEYHEWYSLGAVGFLVGYSSHLVMDSLNPTGIMYLWPLSRKRCSIMKLRTGGHEWIARWIFIAITLCYLYFVKSPNTEVIMSAVNPLVSAVEGVGESLRHIIN